MAGVFRDVTIAWNGVDYVVTPSNRLLRRIEQEVSLTKMTYRIVSGEPPQSEMAYVMAELLKSGGATVTEDEVAQAMAHGSENEVLAMATALLSAITPTAPVAVGKKAEAPA